MLNIDYKFMYESVIKEASKRGERLARLEVDEAIRSATLPIGFTDVIKPYYFDDDVNKYVEFRKKIEVDSVNSQIFSKSLDPR